MANWGGWRSGVEVLGGVGGKVFAGDGHEKFFLRFSEGIAREFFLPWGGGPDFGDCGWEGRGGPAISSETAHLGTFIPTCPLVIFP